MPVHLKHSICNSRAQYSFDLYKSLQPPKKLFKKHMMVSSLCTHYLFIYFYKILSFHVIILTSLKNDIKETIAFPAIRTIIFEALLICADCILQPCHAVVTNFVINN